MPGAEGATRAMGQRDFAILDLARSAFAAELLHRLDHQENSAHTRMVRRESAAVGVQREVAVIAQAAATNKRPALAALTEPKILQGGQDGNGERVIDHRHVNVFVRDASPLKGKTAGLIGRDFEKIALAARRVA